MLKWILIGGRVDDDAPSVSRVLILDRDLGEVVLNQEKLLPSFLEQRQLTLRGLEQPPDPAAPDPAAPGLAAPGPAAPGMAVQPVLPEDVSVGARLNVMQGSLGWIAIMAGDYPSRIEPAVRHVTHLLRAGLASCAALERQCAEPSPADGLVVSGGMLISELDPAAPLSGAAITLPGRHPQPDGYPPVAAYSAADRAVHPVESVTVFAFEPDDIAIASLAPSADGARLHALAPASAASGETATAVRALRRTHLAGVPGPVRSYTAELEALIPRFAIAGESRQAARALHHIACANADCGQLTSAQQAVDQMLAITRRDGAQYLEAQGRTLGCLLNNWGDRPLAEIVAFAGGELDWARTHGYPQLALMALGVLAQAHALLGQPGPADELARQAAQLGEELLLGPDSVELAAHDTVAMASVMIASGDLTSAAAALDRGDWALRRIAATRSRSGILVLSARVRCRLQADRDAWELLGACDGAAPDDVVIQAQLRGVRGLLLARQGQFLDAEREARSAVEASNRSERLDVRAQARADLATVLIQGDREKEAVLPAMWALRLLERRGDVVSASAIREMIPDHEPASDWPLQVEAWVMAAKPCMVAGQASQVGVRIHSEASLGTGYPGGRPDQPAEILVTLLAAGAATVKPNSMRLRLPSAGVSEPLVFQITPCSAMPLYLHFLVNLYREGTLLKELGVTIPVMASGSRSI